MAQFWTGLMTKTARKEWTVVHLETYVQGEARNMAAPQIARTKNAWDFYKTRAKTKTQS